MKTFKQLLTEGYIELKRRGINSKEDLRRALVMWDTLPQGKKRSEAKFLLKMAEELNYTIKKKEVLAYAEEKEVVKTPMSNDNKDLDLSKLRTIPEEFELPESINGDLNLKLVRKLPNDFKFPKKVNGDLDLTELEYLPMDCEFPESINGDLDLSSLGEFSSEYGSRLPSGIKNLYLGSIETFQKIDNMPKTLNGDLDLQNVTTIDADAVFPETINGNLNLFSLKELSKKVKFPKRIKGDLNLESFGTTFKSLYIPADFKFPEVDGKIFISKISKSYILARYPHLKGKLEVVLDY